MVPTMQSDQFQFVKESLGTIGHSDDRRELVRAGVRDSKAVSNTAPVAKNWSDMVQVVASSSVRHRRVCLNGQNCLIPGTGGCKA